MKYLSNSIVVLLVLAGFTLATANSFAAKPDWAGKDNESAQAADNGQAEKYQRERQRIENQQGHEKGESERERSRIEKEGEEAKQGMQKEKKQQKQSMDSDKQKARKMNQEQKELGKGSEQGQESREQRKKWWRFWE